MPVSLAQFGQLDGVGALAISVDQQVRPLLQQEVRGEVQLRIRMSAGLCAST